MTTVKGPLGDKARRVTGDALQAALVDVLDLSLTAKQAHWNLLGTNFRSLHLQLDEIVTAARGFADDLAERAVALGVTPDGRAGTIAKSTEIKQLSDGWVQDREVVSHFVQLFEELVGRMRERIEATAEPDPISQDLLITVTAELEKQSWMLQAQHQ